MHYKILSKIQGKCFNVHPNRAVPRFVLKCGTKWQNSENCKILYIDPKCMTLTSGCGNFPAHLGKSTKTQRCTRTHGSQPSSMSVNDDKEEIIDPTTTIYFNFINPIHFCFY